MAAVPSELEPPKSHTSQPISSRQIQDPRRLLKTSGSTAVSLELSCNSHGHALVWLAAVLHHNASDAHFTWGLPLQITRHTNEQSTSLSEPARLPSHFTWGLDLEGNAILCSDNTSTSRSRSIRSRSPSKHSHTCTTQSGVCLRACTPALARGLGGCRRAASLLHARRAFYLGS